MKRKVTLSSAMFFDLSQKSGSRVSSTRSPLTQLFSLNGPVPTGLVLLSGVYFGSTITAAGQARRYSRSPDGLSRCSTSVSGAGVSIEVMTV